MTTIQLDINRKKAERLVLHYPDYSLTMEDDIDDLLNEVESKYCVTAEGKSKKITNPQKSKKSTSPSLTSRTRPKKKDDLAEMIEDIFVDGDPLNDTNTQAAPNLRANSSCSSFCSTTDGQKCFQLFVGGSESVMGVATTVNQRTCDRMRCTDCDFCVKTFDNFQWHRSVDYLFLRNNMPDFERLKGKLVSKPGYRAYACQCKSLSVRDPEELTKHANLKWFCSRH